MRIFSMLGEKPREKILASLAKKDRQEDLHRFSVWQILVAVSALMVVELTITLQNGILLTLFEDKLLSRACHL